MARSRGTFERHVPHPELTRLGVDGGAGELRRPRATSEDRSECGDERLLGDRRRRPRELADLHGVREPGSGVVADAAPGERELHELRERRLRHLVDARSADAGGEDRLDLCDELCQDPPGEHGTGDGAGRRAHDEIGGGEVDAACSQTGCEPSSQATPTGPPPPSTTARFDPPLICPTSGVVVGPTVRRGQSTCRRTRPSSGARSIGDVPHRSAIGTSVRSASAGCSSPLDGTEGVSDGRGVRGGGGPGSPGATETGPSQPPNRRVVEYALEQRAFGPRRLMVAFAHADGDVRTWRTPHGSTLPRTGWTPVYP